MKERYPPCPHCGSTIRPGVSTCPVCGPHAHGRPEPIADSERKPKRQRLLVIPPLVWTEVAPGVRIQHSERRPMYITVQEWAAQND